MGKLHVNTNLVVIVGCLGVAVCYYGIGKSEQTGDEVNKTP